SRSRPPPAATQSGRPASWAPRQRPWEPGSLSGFSTYCRLSRLHARPRRIIADEGIDFHADGQNIGALLWSGVHRFDNEQLFGMVQLTDEVQQIAVGSLIVGRDSHHAERVRTLDEFGGLGAITLFDLSFAGGCRQLGKQSGVCDPAVQEVLV